MQSGLDFVAPCRGLMLGLVGSSLGRPALQGEPCRARGVLLRSFAKVGRKPTQKPGHEATSTRRPRTIPSDLPSDLRGTATKKKMLGAAPRPQTEGFGPSSHHTAADTASSLEILIDVPTCTFPALCRGGLPCSQMGTCCSHPRPC